MKVNYFSIHKNKKPKKINYSKKLSIKQKEAIDDLYLYFDRELEILKNKI